MHFEYSKASILKFVNENLNCDFDRMKVRNTGFNIFDIKESACDCCTIKYEPFKNIEVNILELDSVKPINSDGRWAAYAISYDSVMKIPYMRKLIEQQIENGNTFSKNEAYSISFRWDSKGIITGADIHAKISIGASAEDVSKLIKIIKKDNKTQ